MIPRVRSWRLPTKRMVDMVEAQPMMPIPRNIFAKTIIIIRIEEMTAKTKPRKLEILRGT